jgi:hypothetical protein
MSLPSLNNIYYAIYELDREAQFRRNLGGSSNYERARDLDRIRKDAIAVYNQLSEAMPRLRSLKVEADRSYDRYVTRPPLDEGCSCHINAPCSFCTRAIDRAEAAISGAESVA